MTWSCPYCNRIFSKTNQKHYCSDKYVSDFLAGKSEHAIALFDNLIEALTQFGPIKLETTKSMIVLVSRLRFAYVIGFGKTFIDVVLPSSEAYTDNYCFRKIGLIPGSNTYNHHLRLMSQEDLNEEVLSYLEKAYRNGEAV